MSEWRMWALPEEEVSQPGIVKESPSCWPIRHPLPPCHRSWERRRGTVLGQNGLLTEKSERMTQGEQPPKCPGCFPDLKWDTGKCSHQACPQSRASPASWVCWCSSVILCNWESSFFKYLGARERMKMIWQLKYMPQETVSNHVEVCPVEQKY